MTRPAPIPSRSRAVTITPVPYDHPDARLLTEALYAEQLALYGFADSPLDTPPPDFAPPDGLFLIARLRGEDRAVACGGWRRLGDSSEAAELKRMYVHPDVRGRGHGHEILRALETSAADAGIRRLLLETGRDNTDALALYTRCGYRPIPPYVPGRDPRINRALTRQIG
jgi:GNAT superfamily N-acetyltransferase